jgi:glycine dehydrogenase subunit 1
MTLLGEKGLRQLAMVNHNLAVVAADALGNVPGVEVVNNRFFNEFTLRLPQEARPVARRLAERGILGGVSLGRLYPGESQLANGLVVAVTETVTVEDIDALQLALREVLA